MLPRKNTRPRQEQNTGNQAHPTSSPSLSPGIRPSQAVSLSMAGVSAGACCCNAATGGLHSNDFFDARALPPLLVDGELQHTHRAESFAD